jgi:diacylglycerol kinase (ATP)
MGCHQRARSEYRAASAEGSGRSPTIRLAGSGFACDSTVDISSFPPDGPPPDAAAALPRPITLIINGHSRRGKLLFASARAALEAAGVPLAEAVAVESLDETLRILKREVAEGARLVIVGGGDGTLSTCADYLVHTDVAMGVLPLGTGNTWARSLGLPLDLDEAARVIARGHVEATDVGRVNGQVFLNSVSLGLSCEIAGALSKEVKKKLGLLAWPVVGARVLWGHKPLLVKVSSSDSTFRVRTHQLLVVNGRYVAGPISATPDASVQDSSLDVFTLGGAKRGSLLRTTWRWLRGSHRSDPASRYFSTRKLRIESLRKPIPANVDGEINEMTPLEIEVLPGALKVVVPHDFVADEV